jgi:hypothetical protein
MATPDWVAKELRAHAARVARRAPVAGPRAAKAKYLARGKALQVELTNGVIMQLPVKLIPGLEHEAPRNIRAVEVAGRGGSLHWPGLDLDLSVPSLVSSAFEGRPPAHG